MNVRKLIQSFTYIVYGSLKDMWLFADYFFTEYKIGGIPPKYKRGLERILIISMHLFLFLGIYFLTVGPRLVERGVGIFIIIYYISFRLYYHIVMRRIIGNENEGEFKAELTNQREKRLERIIKKRQDAIIKIDKDGNMIK